ncbi:hypothetical protein DFH28DRAFT_1131779 [Melampsora americana]|nr:hypothetical protein DFH28DRAFT_1131779 [Melampsora americana]
MAPSQSRAFGNLLNPHPAQSNVASGSQNPYAGPTLHGLNNHVELSTSSMDSRGALRDAKRTSSQSFDCSDQRGNHTDSAPGGETRRRAKLKPMTTLVKTPRDPPLSPAPQSSQSQKRPRANSPNRLESRFEDVAAEQPRGMEPTMSSGLEPGPSDCELSQYDRSYLDDIVQTIGMDDKHGKFAIELAEVTGESHRHLAMCAIVSRFSYMITSLEARLERMEDNMSSHFTTLSAHMEEQLETLTGRLSSKITNLNANLNELREVIESGNLPQSGGQSGTGLVPAETSATTQKTKRTKWEASKELKSHLNELAVLSIPASNIQAYTALEDGALKFLQRSLYNMIRGKVGGGDNDQWVAEQLPSKIRGVSDGEGLRNYATAIKDAGKHAREKLHLLLLTNINNQRSGAVKKVAVPDLPALWHRIALKCGLINSSVDAGTAWTQADGPLRTRVAYLRREAARLRSNPSSIKIWGEVDNQLDKLREMDKTVPDYSASFYNIMYENDGKIFNGKRTWDEITDAYELTLPSEEDILAGTAGAHAVDNLAPGSDNEERALSDPNDN